MGNNRFGLSDMIPNAWFYKLKDISRTRKHNVTTHSVKKKQSPSTAAAVAAQPPKLKNPHPSHPRKSYHFTREHSTSDQKFHNPNTSLNSIDTNLLAVPPRKSSKQRLRRRPTTIKSSSPKLFTSSVSAGCSCRATTIWTKSDSPPASSSDSSPETEAYDSFPSEFRSARCLATESFDNMLSWSSSCGRKVEYSNANDIVIDVDKLSLANKSDKFDGFDSISDLDLPPIITKPAKVNDEVENFKKKLETKESTKYRRSSTKYGETNAQGSLSVKVVKEGSMTMKEHKNSSSRRSSVYSPGVRLRINSPRIASKRIQAHGRRSLSLGSNSCARKSLSDSLAIVKSSFDPQRDFRDSMVEMIVQNNIRASKDLEDLLACYLSLNADEYHDLIIEVFKQIWLDLTDILLE